MSVGRRSGVEAPRARTLDLRLLQRFSSRESALDAAVERTRARREASRNRRCPSATSRAPRDRPRTQVRISTCGLPKRVSSRARYRSTSTCGSMPPRSFSAADRFREGAAERHHCVAHGVGAELSRRTDAHEATAPRREERSARGRGDQPAEERRNRGSRRSPAASIASSIGVSDGKGGPSPRASAAGSRRVGAPRRVRGARTARSRRSSSAATRRARCDRTGSSSEVRGSRVLSTPGRSTPAPRTPAQLRHVARAGSLPSALHRHARTRAPHQRHRDLVRLVLALPLTRLGAGFGLAFACCRCGRRGCGRVLRDVGAGDRHVVGGGRLQSRIDEQERTLDLGEWRGDRAHRCSEVERELRHRVSVHRIDEGDIDGVRPRILAQRHGQQARAESPKGARRRARRWARRCGPRGTLVPRARDRGAPGPTGRSRRGRARAAACRATASNSARCSSPGCTAPAASKRRPRSRDTVRKTTSRRGFARRRHHGLHRNHGSNDTSSPSSGPTSRPSRRGTPPLETPDHWRCPDHARLRRSPLPLRPCHRRRRPHRGRRHRPATRPPQRGLRLRGRDAAHPPVDVRQLADAPPRSFRGDARPRIDREPALPETSLAAEHFFDENVFARPLEA